MRKLRALCPEPGNFSVGGLESFSNLFELNAVPMSQAEFDVAATEYEVLLVRLRIRVTGSLIARSSHLRLIISPTTGVDHLDLDAASKASVTVITLKGETELLRAISSTAELTWALLLALVRRLPLALDSVRRGDWEQGSFRGRELRGKTLGIVGVGRLGTMVARYGAAFDMHVLASDPAVSSPPPFVDRLLPLPMLLKESDVVSLHVPLSPQTHHLIDRSAIATMNKQAVLVNTSRGAIVDSAALVDALAENRIAGAAVDVLPDESMRGRKDDILLAYAREHDNLLITPHIGGACEEAISLTDQFVAKCANEWLQTNPRPAGAGDK